MTSARSELPDDPEALRAMLRAAEARVRDRDAKIQLLETRVVDRDAEIENLKLTIAKMQRDRFGASSERGRKLLDQLELQLAELEESQAQDDVADEIAYPGRATDTKQRKPARRPLPDHLPRERVVHPGPCDCPVCGGRLRKLGEDVTETLEHVPASWKVIQHVREKFSCRQCEAICQAPAPNHPIARHGEAVLRTEAAPARTCWPRSCSTSTAHICH
jgi:DNA repair exonuclease SbcCD ATPase subunit